MTRRLVATVIVGASTFLVYLAVGGGVQAQHDYLDSLGMTTPNRVATCPVRINDDCIGWVSDAGVSVHKYERLRFPVIRTAGTQIDIQLPPMPLSLVLNGHACLEVIDWTDCTLDTVATFPTVAAKWGDAIPFSKSGVTKKCVRRNTSGGFPNCLRNGVNFGEMNVFLLTEATVPANCEAVECVVAYGDNPDLDL